MNNQDAKDLGEQIALLLEAGEISPAVNLLSPVLATRTPFRFLTLIGQGAGAVRIEAADPFCKQIAQSRTEGGWVVIGGVFYRQLANDMPGAFSRCREFIVSGDVWYAADSLAERVPGPALVACFEPAQSLLILWRTDENRWVRRAAGVAIHFWAKRAHGAAKYFSEAERLLNFIKPMVAEREMDAVKGVGWGLKTLGKYYPDLVANWLSQLDPSIPMRALMLRKALTYLSPEQRARVEG